MGAVASAGRKPPKKNSEVIFSTSEIEKTTSEVVGFSSDVVLWLLDAHRGKKWQKVGGRGEGRKMGLSAISAK